MGVPVIGYGTDRFPEFFSQGKNLPVSITLGTPQDVIKFANNHWGLGMKSAVLVCQPIPDGYAIPAHEISEILEQVSDEVVKLQAEHRIKGQEVTPYELKRVNELSKGKSLRANLELLLNNARLAALLARELVNGEKQQQSL
jgi:pseudouridine-5'-phosphate glycosidase